MEPKHYACAVIWRQEPGSRIEFLVQDVISTYEVLNPQAWPGESPTKKVQGSKQSKFVGGMQRLPEDSLAVTLTREIVEETNLRFSGELREIWSGPVYDRTNRTKIDHIKHAFLVPFSECTGELRTDTLPDGNDLMFPPKWIPADEVGRILYATHQPILLAALKTLGLL